MDQAVLQSRDRKGVVLFVFGWKLNADR